MLQAKQFHMHRHTHAFPHSIFKTAQYFEFEKQNMVLVEE
jgi:hypothetical protein